MPLGFMAKDSIQDFTLLANDGEDKLAEIPHDKVADAGEAKPEDAVTESNRSNNSNSAAADDGTTSSVGSGCSVGSQANPQQAQEEENAEVDQAAIQAAAATPSAVSASSAAASSNAPPQQASQQPQPQYAGFKSDYWAQQQLNNNSATNHNPKSAYGAYDASYFYDPYATSASGGHHGTGSSMYLLDRSNSMQSSQQTSTLLRCLLPCLFPWQQGPPPTSHHDAALPLEAGQASDRPSASAAHQQPAEQQPQPTVTSPEKSSGPPAPADDAEETVASNASDNLGEKLSDRERQAVLARLRLAQPAAEDEGTTSSDSADNSSKENAATEAAARSSTNSDKQGLLPETPPKKPLKGILKKRRPNVSNANQDLSALAAAATAVYNNSKTSSAATPNSIGTADGSKTSASSGTGAGVGPRRSLFPSYSYDGYSGASPSGMDGLAGSMRSQSGDGGQYQRRPKRHATFAPMARVMTVKSKNDMTPQEKAAIWWMKSDYEDFRKAGRIISRAMVEGGSEIWLQFSRSCRAAAKKKAAQAKKDRDNADKNKSDDVDVDDDDECDDKSDDSPDMEATGDKWWHEFGHSRRGLEHVVSIEEGRQRQQNVRNAIQFVLEEQARQKLYRRQVDAGKLRLISLQYTSWARDLALASGSSDADAVKSAFAEDRKSREFYLGKLMDNKTSGKSAASSSASSSMRASAKIIASDLYVPDFMRESSLRENSAISKTIQTPTPDLLDANTAAQIRYRRKKNKDKSSAAAASAATTSAESKDKKKADASSSVTSTADSNTTEEPVHDARVANEDDKNKEKTESMAQRAAGFSSKGEAKVNMAAVLSGMGAVPQNPKQVTSTA